MIGKEELIKLGFQYTKSPFIRKKEWSLGKQNVVASNIVIKNLPIIIFDIDTQIAKTTQGEFNNIFRKCNNEFELIMFVKSIMFLYNITEFNMSNINQQTFDWNSLTLDQIVKHLKLKYTFSNSPDTNPILRLIEFYNQHK